MCFNKKENSIRFPYYPEHDWIETYLSFHLIRRVKWKVLNFKTLSKNYYFLFVFQNGEKKQLQPFVFE